MKHLTLLQIHKLGVDVKECVAEMAGEKRLLSERGDRYVEKKP